MKRRTKPSIAYVLDPRFPGGTSSAVAAELDVVVGLGRVVVHALSSSMFKGQVPAPQLQGTLTRLDVPLIWDAKEIAADIVIFHNPSCLRFQQTLDVKILTPHLVVVAHENFLRPGGAEAFDVATCLDIIDRSAFASKRTLAPISAWNRKTISDWQEKLGHLDRWSVLDLDWFNICDFPLVDPVELPRDRRGRHSRPGIEKFPQHHVMEQCFPAHAEANVLLGADAFMNDPLTPAHWDLHRFRSLSVDAYFEMIDFMIYFTAPTFRESYGRVLAEAVAAGKIAISDPETASAFGGAVQAATPQEVNGMIQSYIDNPSTYRSDIRAAQRALEQFSPSAFATRFNAVFAEEMSIN